MTTSKAHMPDGPRKLLDMFIKDLKTFDPGEIHIMAIYMGIPWKRVSHGELCGNIAEKLLLVHSESLPDTDKSKCIRYHQKFTVAQITKIRRKIYRQFSRFKNSVADMTTDDLHDLFKAYDNECFFGDLQKYMRDAQFTIRFRTSGEPTFTTEGICTTSCDYIMTIPIEPFRTINGPTNVAGHICKDQLECLQRVIEHEMTHLIIFMLCGDSFVMNQHNELFMKMVSDLFGHTDHRHYIF